MLPALPPSPPYPPNAIAPSSSPCGISQSSSTSGITTTTHFSGSLVYLGRPSRPAAEHRQTRPPPLHPPRGFSLFTSLMECFNSFVVVVVYCIVNHAPDSCDLELFLYFWKFVVGPRGRRFYLFILPLVFFIFFIKALILAFAIYILFGQPGVCVCVCVCVCVSPEELIIYFFHSFSSLPTRASCRARGSNQRSVKLTQNRLKLTRRSKEV